MANKKRHHYIPRFYLKRFSIDDEGKFIRLYNLQNKKLVEQAPLKHQAYENFLYGNDDEIENALAEMENNIAKMFYYWTEEKVLIPPPSDSNGFILLRSFILYQAFRTPKSGAGLLQSLNDGIMTVLKDVKPELWKQLQDCTIHHDNPVLLSLANSIEHEKLLGYLDCRFLVNLSELPFITSDSPVVFYNQLMEAAGNYIGATGLVAKGLQIFYPIHPRLMICFYDPKVYDIGNGCSNCCSTESIEDIHQLNALQFINCKAQLFFNEEISPVYITKLIDQYSDDREKDNNINTVININQRKFFFTGSEEAKIDLKVSFCNQIISSADYKNMLVPIRHPSFKRPSIPKIDFSK